MKNKLAIVAFCIVLLPTLFTILQPYGLRAHALNPDKLFPLIAAFIALISILQDTSGSKLPYIIFIFCLVLIAITKLPRMECEFDASSISMSLDGIANALRR